MRKSHTHQDYTQGPFKESSLSVRITAFTPYRPINGPTASYIIGNGSSIEEGQLLPNLRS